jgi:hypothetical protein
MLSRVQKRPLPCTFIFSMPTLLLQREIDSLNKRLLQLGGQVEENLRLGVQSLQTRNNRKTDGVWDED